MRLGVTRGPAEHQKMVRGDAMERWREKKSTTSARQMESQLVGGERFTTRMCNRDKRGE